MDDRLARIELALQDLTTRLARLEQRAAAFEAGHPEPATTGLAPAEPAAAAPAAEIPPRSDLVSVLSLIGRTLIVLAGGYLLRAMTEAGAMPAPVGVALGILYALAWLVAADRAAGAGRQMDVVFHGLAMTVIAFPLVWEATVRFQILAPTASATALAVLTAFAFLVAYRRGHRWLAWTTMVMALGTALVLYVATARPVPYTAFLLLLGNATLWLSYGRAWPAIRWPPAIVVNLAVVGLALRALSPATGDPPGPVIALQVALVGTYLASIAARTLYKGRDAIPFEMTQLALALIVGLGGALAVAGATGMGMSWLGLSSLALGVACYAVAFVFIDRRQGRGRNFYFYTSLAVAFILIGSRVLVHGGPLALLWVTLALVACALGVRYTRLALTFHAAFYLSGAAVASDLLGRATLALAGSPAHWQLPSPAMIAVLAAGLACASMPAGRYTSIDAAIVGVPRFLIVATVVWGAGGALIELMVWALAARGGGVDDGALIATIRTIVLSASALLLASASRAERWRECGWLVYPVLLVTGIKLLIDDLRASGHAYLFIALSAYGLALVLAPRFLHRRRLPDAHASGARG